MIETKHSLPHKVISYISLISLATTCTVHFMLYCYRPCTRISGRFLANDLGAGHCHNCHADKP